MPVELDLVVANPALQRTAYTHLKVYSSATETGVFAEITAPTTRVPLTEAISYTYRNAAANPAHWFKYSYYNAKTGDESDLGAAVQGETDPALDVISIDELKEVYLFGVDLTNDAGVPYPNGMMRWYIKSAVSYLEHYLDIPIREKVVLAERHDFYAEQFQKFQMFRVENIPVISVQEVRLTYPSQPLSQRIYPSEWVQVVKAAGLVEIVPGSGAVALPFFGGGGLLMPAIYGGMTRSVPHMLECDYTAGFERGQIPDAIKHAAGMLASMGPLNIAGDLIAGAGIASYGLSLDGLSQSVSTTSSATNAGYGARIIQYQKDLKPMLAELRRYYRGIKIESV